jgi:hypothetical protein
VIVIIDYSKDKEEIEIKEELFLEEVEHKVDKTKELQKQVININGEIVII